MTTYRTLAASLLCALLVHPGQLRAEEPAEKAADKPAATATTPAPAAAKDVHREAGVNINTASLSELQLLPGIGERKAEDIVSRREKKKFARPEDLMEVKGIGRGIFKRVKPYVRVTGPTTLAQKVTASRGGTKRT